MRSRKSSSLIPSGALVQRETQKKGDENMLGSQKETELKGGEKKICILSHLEQRRKGDVI